MNVRTHLLIASSCSMIITFILYSIVDQTKVANSLVQKIAMDAIHEFFLTMRCWLGGRYGLRTCAYLIMSQGTTKFNMFLTILGLIVIIFLSYGLERTLILPLILTPLTVWLLSCSFDGQRSRYTVDIITVYLFVWQFIYVMCAWRRRELSWPFIVLRHISSCVLCSIGTFFLYHLEIRYLSSPTQFAYLWLWSLFDIFVCLHFNGRFRSWQWRLFTSSSPTDVYYSQVFEDRRQDIEVLNDNDKWKKLNDNGLDYTKIDFKILPLGLDLGDFTAFNLMVLISFSPCWSMSKKIFVAFGSIISIQLGQWIMRVCQQLFLLNIIPALPFSLISFSIFTVVVNGVMDYINFN